MYNVKTFLLYNVILSLFLISTMSILAQNIVTNSGFEVGKTGELPEEWRSQKEGGSEGEIFLTDKEAHNGKLSLFIENTNGEGYIHPNKSEITKPPQNINIWDTMEKMQDIESKIQDKVRWKALSIDGSGQLLESSSLKGDLAIEDNFTIAIFCSELGNVVVYSKSGQKRTEIKPILSKNERIKIVKYIISRPANEKLIIETIFSDKGSDIPVTFIFGKRQIIELKPARGIDKINIFCPMEYGIVPNFISDDLIFDPKNFAYKDALNIPSERLFLGLFDTKDCELFITSPLANQDIRLILGKDKKTFESIEIKTDGQSIYLSLLEAPNIWHKEELKPSYLESDIQINWTRPFPAKWITQLYEDNVKTTYTFKATKPKEDGFWRAAIGWYTYPVWFEEDKAFIRTGKKVPPKGDAIIYFLERSGTPTSILTPVDIIKATLDPDISESILDPKGRRNRSLTRPNCAVGTATCEVTDQIKRVIEAGKEVENAEYIRGGTEDMIYFLAKENERAMEYQNFAKEMLNFLSSIKSSKPDQIQFIEKMENITRELISAYENERENLKDATYAKKIAEETIALTKQKSPDNLYNFIRLKEEWTGMGGAVDDLNRTLHTITRKLFQEAGYSCIDNSETVRLAEQIRNLTIACLRNPGGYEIWSDY